MPELTGICYPSPYSYFREALNSMIFIFKQRLTREISSGLQSFLGPGIVRKFQVVRPSSSLESRENEASRDGPEIQQRLFFSFSGMEGKPQNGSNIKKSEKQVLKFLLLRRSLPLSVTKALLYKWHIRWPTRWGTRTEILVLNQDPQRTLFSENR